MRYLGTDAAKKISKIGLGTWQFGSPEWAYGDHYAAQHARAIVRRALELGVTLFDTSEIYGFEARPLACRALVRGVAMSDMARIRGFGRSERILGQALGECGELAFVATKFYPTVPVAPAVEQRAKASAARLGIGKLDLYQIHHPGRLIRYDTVMRSIRTLQQAGTVAEMGLSNGSLAGWRAAEDALGGRVLSNQVCYSLVARSAERDLLPFARSHDRIVIAFSPLAHGLLSGKFDSASRPVNPVRAADPLFLPENLERLATLIATLREVAHAHSATPAQVALAWVIRHPSVAAIPGASSVEQLESNVAAADIELTDGEYHALQLASAQFRPVPGPRSLARRLGARLWSRFGQ
jgi:aryl-alcohol dehydrogenase-like predicted oxidoreductase